MARMLESLMESIYAMAKKSATDYSNLETTMGARTFVYRSGTLATVLRYVGISKIVGSEETRQIVQSLHQALNPFFLRKVHELQMVMDRDVMPMSRMVKRMGPMYDTAKRLHLDEVMHDIFDEQAATMAARTMEDTITIVLYTNASAIRPEDYKDWVRQLTEERRKGAVHVPAGTQDETFGIDPLLALHDAFVDQVSATLSDSDIGGQIEVLNAAEATNILAKSLDPLGTSDEWRAWMLPEADAHLARRMHGESLTRMPTEAIRKASPKVRKIANTSIFFPPPLNEQLICHEAKYPKDGYMEYAGRLYSTLGMVIPPRRVVQASTLIHALSGMQSRASGGESERVPYRLSIRMRGNGMRQGALRANIAPLVSVGSYNNIKLMRAYKALQKEANDDMAVASISMSLTTWVNASEHKATEKLKSRVVALRSAASQWGDMSMVEGTIDRVQAFLNSCPAITLQPSSNEATGSLAELLPLLPWGRPASPLGSYGTEIYRSLDGAILPLASHSAEQDFWLETMTAPMGGGKSAQANRKHLDYIFAPGRTTLPFLHILDIGGSVSGMVEMIQDALPNDQKHLAYMHVLRNDRSNAVNMLDTKLGLRHPLEGDLQATVDWLTSLVTPAERSKPYENMGEFCKAVLIALYKRFDDATDNGQPRIYKRGNSVIDTALEEARVDIQPGTPWFGVADILGSKQNYPAALMAHRLAMPVLSDLAAIANDDNVRGDYMAAVTEMGMPIPQAFSVQLSLARESYPIFTDTTVLDLRGRRITAIDLQEAATKGNASARKQASLMYQVAYELFSRNIRITDDDIKSIPRVWRGYYANLIEELKNTDKHVTIDEYHRTQIQELTTKDAADHDTQGIRQTLVREGGRESRKWGLSLLTISQLSADHGQLFQLASGNHIIKRGSNDETKFQKEALKLSSTDMAAMQHFVNGPTKDGVTFLTQWTTKKGKFNQIFTSTVGPKTLWSLSSTFEDKTIRKIVFDNIGRNAGRTVLARSFPKGSAKEEVDRRKRTVKADVMDDAVEGACREVANELIAQYRANPFNFQ